MGVRKLHISWFEESGASYPVSVSYERYCHGRGLLSGFAKRYRQLSAKRRSKTLAAALIMCWRHGRKIVVLVDPFCGSGHFRLKRRWWQQTLRQVWIVLYCREWTNPVIQECYDAVNEANDLIQDDVEVDIRIWYWSGRGKSGEKECRRCRRGSYDPFSAETVQDLRHRRNTVLSSQIRRMEASWGEKELPKLSLILEKVSVLWILSQRMITSWRCRALFGRKQTKQKIYNGMLKTYFTSYRTKTAKAKEIENNRWKENYFCNRKSE